jgi:DNA-binding beta-propeller fold protein YncE
MKKHFAVLIIALALLLLPLAGNGLAQSAGTMVAGGFNGPQGLLVDPEGNIWVADSGLGGEQELAVINDPQTGEATTIKAGDTARVVKIAPDGTQTEIATLPSVSLGQETSGAGRLALLDGTLYVTSAGWQEAWGAERLPLAAAVVKLANGSPAEVAETWSLEKSSNPGGFVLDTHPYDLEAGPDGMLWIADAGGNDLLKVDPASGKVELVAAFAGLPGPIANAARGGAQEIDPVPTGIAFDQDGVVFVSFLPGIPFLPGSAKVVTVAADGTYSDYAMGLTMITDLATGPDGELYAVQIGLFTQQGPVPNSGALLRIKEGNATSEVLVDGLSFPTSIAFDPAGDAYVTTNGLGAPGSGEVLKFAALTSLTGPTVAETAAASSPTSLPTTGGSAVAGWWALLAAGAVLLAGGWLLTRRLAYRGIGRD